ADECCDAVANGTALLLLSDRATNAERAPSPALLATASAHQGLIARGLRMRASLVVETSDARDAHQLAALIAFGASAVCPTLGYETIAEAAASDPTGCNRPIVRYRMALERGLLTIMSKMGVCTAASYCGAQLFEALGLEKALVDKYFPGAPATVGNIG